jgi:hypothetical protein
MERSLPTLLTRFLQPNDAITITQRVVLSEQVVDAKVVFATPPAAHLYGFDNPNQLIGLWLSELVDESVRRKGFIISYCRHRGIPINGKEVPETYISVIKRKDGQPVNVVKHTLEIVDQDDIYWLTQLKLFTGTEDEKDIPHLNDFILDETSSDYLRWAGLTSMADVNRTVSSLFISRNSFLTRTHNRHNIEPDKNDIESSQLVGRVGGDEQIRPDGLTIPIQLNAPSPHSDKTGKGVQQRYLHGPCTECGGEWIGTSPNPPHCNYCRSRQWRGYSRWDVNRLQKDTRTS